MAEEEAEKETSAVTTANILKALYESVMQDKENAENNQQQQEENTVKIDSWLEMNRDPMTIVPQLNLANYPNYTFEPISCVFPTNQIFVPEQRQQPKTDTILLFHVHLENLENYQNDNFILKVNQIAAKEFFLNDLIVHKCENLYNALMACLGVVKNNENILKLNKMLCQSIPDKFNYMVERYREVTCVLNSSSSPSKLNCFLTGMLRFFERNNFRFTNVIFSSNMHMSMHLAMAVLSGVNKYLPVENNYSYYRECEFDCKNQLNHLMKRFSQKNLLVVTNDQKVYEECEEVNLACYLTEKIQDFVYLCDVLEAGLI